MDHEALKRRFYSKVNKNGPTQQHAVGLGPCWEWTASRFQSGYGQIKVDGKNWKAHRLAWVLEVGEVGDDLCVLHRCDNHGCVNLAHLFLGSNADNSADMVAKGRQARGDRHMSRTSPQSIRRGDNHPLRLRPELCARGDRSGSRLHPERLARGDRNGSRVHPESLRRGESHGRAKLTEASVREIRRLVEERMGTQKEIGKRFGVTQVLVGKVARREIWKHVA